MHNYIWCPYYLPGFSIICSCAYYQEILIAWILWELCPFEFRNFPKFTTEAACQHNSSETTGQNFMKLGRYIYIYIQVSVRDITLECLQITPTKFRWSTFPGNMHNYIWCPYYLPSFMKFCPVVSEELCWQAASEVNFGKFLSPPTFVGRHIVFVLSVTQFVSATPLKLLNRISWNLVDSKDTICSCAYYQEILKIAQPMFQWF
jgi:hypothetical protein